MTSYPQFGSAFALSLRLALIATVLTLVLMVPTAVYVHLRLPRIRRLMEAITILPIVIPPIVLIIGVLKVAPGFLHRHAEPARPRVRHPGDAVRLPLAGFGPAVVRR